MSELIGRGVHVLEEFKTSNDLHSKPRLRKLWPLHSAQERAAQAPEAPPTSHAALRNSPDTQRARLIPVTKHAA